MEPSLWVRIDPRYPSQNRIYEGSIFQGTRNLSKYHIPVKLYCSNLDLEQIRKQISIQPSTDYETSAWLCLYTRNPDVGRLNKTKFHCKKRPYSKRFCQSAIFQLSCTVQILTWSEFESNHRYNPVLTMKPVHDYNYTLEIPVRVDRAKRSFIAKKALF